MEKERKTRTSVRIPAVLLRRSGLSGADSLGMFALENAVVILKDRMTAADVLSAYESISGLARALFTGLALFCGQCEKCAEPCPYLGEDMDDSAENGMDGLLPIRSLTSETRELLCNCGVCMETLNELLLTGDTVYGEP